MRDVLPLVVFSAIVLLCWAAVGTLDHWCFFRIKGTVRANTRTSLTTAYVVGTLDVKHKPPRLAAVFVYSAPADQLTSIGSEQNFDIFSATAECYEEAKRIAVTRLREHPHLSWALDAYEHPWETDRAR